MPRAILFPRFDHPAVEERYASWQSELILQRAAGGAPLIHYDAGEPMSDVVWDVTQELCFVITDPLLLATPAALDALERALRGAGADAAVPVSNQRMNPDLHASLPEGYLTSRQFEEISEELAKHEDPPRLAEWKDADPGLFVMTRAALATTRATAPKALTGRRVAIAPNALIHRRAAVNGEARLDLADHIPSDAKTILDLACGDGLLGAAIRKRQKARVVGIEAGREEAARARKELDDVYCGDVRELVTIIDQRFDLAIGGDLLEHLDDPWSFLIDLREVMQPGGRLLVKITNAGNWAIVADLLRGRFDFNYLGVGRAGHLRFFTRQTISDALTIAGWDVVSVEPQPQVRNHEFEMMIGSLRAAGIPHSPEELAAPGYYVTARVR